MPLRHPTAPTRCSPNPTSIPMSGVKNQPLIATCTADSVVLRPGFRSTFRRHRLPGPLPDRDRGRPSRSRRSRRQAGPAGIAEHCLGVLCRWLSRGVQRWTHRHRSDRLHPRLAGSIGDCVPGHGGGYPVCAGVRREGIWPQAAIRLHPRRQRRWSRPTRAREHVGRVGRRRPVHKCGRPRRQHARSGGARGPRAGF